MLTQEDIKNLTDYQKEVFVTKEEFSGLSAKMETANENISNLSLEVVNIKEIMATKEDFNRLEAKFDDILTSVDNYAKKSDTYFQEMVMMNQKLNRHEKWFHMIADKLDIKLEY